MFKRGIFLVFILGLFFSVAPPVLAKSYGISPPRLILTIQEGEIASARFNILRNIVSESDVLDVRIDESSFLQLPSEETLRFTGDEMLTGYIFDIDASDLVAGEYLHQFQFVETSDPIYARPGMTLLLGVTGVLKLTVLNEEDYHQFVGENLPTISNFGEQVESGVLASEVSVGFTLRNLTTDTFSGVSYLIEIYDENGKLIETKGQDAIVLPLNSQAEHEVFRLKAGDYQAIAKVMHGGKIILQDTYAFEVESRDRLIDYLILGGIIIFSFYVLGFIFSRKKKA